MPSATTVALLTPARRDEFAARYRECVNSFPFTPTGERLVLAYATERAAARARYAAIQAMVTRGEDTTDAVLLGLLPHAATPANNAHDVWITHAPAINRDLRAGWVAAEDWPRLSAAVLRFIERCLGQPEELRAACAEFAALPGVRGLQMGMLTPILHALRPDAFTAMTHATRTILNRLAGTNYGLRLAAYPDANATLMRLLAEVTEVLGQPPAPALDPADQFDLFCQWVLRMKPASFEQPHAWRVAVADAQQWAQWRAGGYVALTAPPCPEEALLMPEAFAAWRAKQIRRAPAAAHLWSFAHALREGDQVVAHMGAHTQLGIGTITGPYYAVLTASDGHRLPVRWQDAAAVAIKKPAWKTPLGKIQRTDLPEPSSSIGTIIAPMHLAEAPASYLAARANGHAPAYTLARCAEETGLPEEMLARWLHAIDRKGQAIILGPPGVGKTYLAERLARVLSAPAGMVEMVQFHPAYAYEDFVQGLRPQARPDGTLNYLMVPGRFLNFCEQARSFSGRCVLVIDEINRANLAQVLGEVLSLLEYRERALPLAGGGALGIPANVRIIGTMNTADRSLALVDYALRRRFAFLPLPPDYTVLRRFHATSGFPVEKLIGLLQRVNVAIGDPHYALGISYFLRAELADEIADIWQMEIEPYLEEYFFDQPEEVEGWRWAAVQKHLQGPASRRAPRST